jgi:hypothetical protein
MAEQFKKNFCSVNSDNYLIIKIRGGSERIIENIFKK